MRPAKPKDTIVFSHTDFLPVCDSLEMGAKLVPLHEENYVRIAAAFRALIGVSSQEVTLVAPDSLYVLGAVMLAADHHDEDAITMMHAFESHDD